LIGVEDVTAIEIDEVGDAGHEALAVATGEE
jgi:hypothetical protein